jgi:fatty-acyl-CoA synthase
MPVALVKFDPVSGAPVRDQHGLCVRCGVNEAGEAIGEISTAAGKHSGRFEGYADKEASEKKVLRNVFAQGDAWYRTGDLMRKDAQGFYYFVDRIGDTFRWKGENVSTSEVTAAITAFPGVTDAAVFGVQVPGAEGRAGMAALVVESAFDLGAFRQHLLGRLPDYARPVFVRIVPGIEVTGTFKLKKQELERAGLTVEVNNTLYFDDRRAQAYILMDESVSERIRSGKIRL